MWKPYTRLLLNLDFRIPFFFVPLSSLGLYRTTSLCRVFQFSVDAYSQSQELGRQTLYSVSGLFAFVWHIQRTRTTNSIAGDLPFRWRCTTREKYRWLSPYPRTKATYQKNPKKLSQPHNHLQSIQIISTDFITTYSNEIHQSLLASILIKYLWVFASFFSLRITLYIFSLIFQREYIFNAAFICISHYFVYIYPFKSSTQRVNEYLPRRL